MTAPALAISTSNGRFYVHPRSKDQVPSITNVIGMKEKTALRYWSAKQCAIFAAQNLDVLQQLKTEQERIDLVKGAPWRSTSQSSEIGNTVHDWIDQFSRNFILTGGSREWEPEDLGAAPLTARRMWKQFKHLDSYYQIEWLYSEVTCWSQSHGYAGTGDAIVRIGDRIVYTDWKCMTPETMITMADGTEKQAVEVHHGDYVASWDGETIVSSRVTGCGDNGVRPVVRIGTLCGRWLTVTEEHPVLTRDYGWVKACDLTSGMFVRIGAAVPSEDATMSNDDAYLIGLAVGDGGLSHGAVRITTMDPEIVRLLEVYAARRNLKLSKDSSTSGGKASTYTMIGAEGKLGRNPITQMFRELGLMGTLSGSKFVPSAVLTGGREAWLHFLAGYLDTDGCIRTASQGGWTVAWDSKSERLIRQCQSMLTGLGIRSRASKVVSSYTGKKHYYWRLIVGNREAVLKLQSVMPSRAARTQKLANAGIGDLLMPGRSQATPVDYDRVTLVEHQIARPTVWIEVAGTHTHVTNGIISHNTGSGVYSEVGLQLSALAGADYALDDSGNEFELPKPDQFAVGHIRPTYTRLSPLSNIPECFETFLALRQVFKWHCEVSPEVIGYAPQIKAP